MKPFSLNPIKARAQATAASDDPAAQQLALGSRAGLGTASLHHLARFTEKMSLLQAALEGGIRYFDTAPLYGHGSAERVLGRFVREHRSSKSIVVASKIGLVPNPLIGAAPMLLYPYIALRTISTRARITPPAVWQPRRVYSAAYVTKRVEQSLRAMGLDFLDVAYLHEPRIDELKDMAELAEAASSLKRRGLIRAIGISGQHEVARELAEVAPGLVEVMQVEVPHQPNATGNEWIAKNAKVTFGHFRVLAAEGRALSAGEKLGFVARCAVELNPGGTILFSSTKIAHVAEFVSAIHAADQQR